MGGGVKMANGGIQESKSKEDEAKYGPKVIR